MPLKSLNYGVYFGEIGFRGDRLTFVIIVLIKSLQNIAGTVSFRFEFCQHSHTYSAVSASLLFGYRIFIRVF